MSDNIIDDERAEAEAEARDAADQAAAERDEAKRDADGDLTLGRCRFADRHRYGYCTSCGYGMTTGT